MHRTRGHTHTQPFHTQCYLLYGTHAVPTVETVTFLLFFGSEEDSKTASYLQIKLEQTRVFFFLPHAENKRFADFNLCDSGKNQTHILGESETHGNSNDVQPSTFRQELC